MTDISVQTSGNTETRILIPAIERLGIPVLIFGLVFSVLVGLVMLIATPDRFPVRIGDTVVRIVDLEREQERVLQETRALKDRQEKLRSDDRAPTLHQLRLLSKDVLPVGAALSAVEDVRRSFIVGSIDPIALPSIQYKDGAVNITGIVRDPGGRSVQLLASFIDALRRIHEIKSVSEPEYTSREKPDGGSESPFAITITLSDA